MKFLTFWAAVTAFLLFGYSECAAQETREAKKYENPKWYQVVMVNYHSGQYGKARKIIDEYFVKADQLAGTPGPVMEMEMHSGTFDLLIVWELQGGLEAMNWQISPDNVKWMNALSELAGGREKAEALLAEYQSYVQNSETQLGRRIK